MFKKCITFLLIMALMIPASRSPSFAGPEDGSIIHVDLGSEHKLEYFAKYLRDFMRLEEMFQKVKGGSFEEKIHIHHVENTLVDPKLATLVDFLDKSDFQISGSILTESEFDRTVTAYENIVPDGHDLRKYLVSYENDTNRVSRLALFLKRLKSHTLGIPNGVTFTEHFFKENNQGQLEWRFPRDSTTTRLAAWITLGGVLNLSLALYLQGKSFTDQEFIIVNSIVATWIFLFINFQREIASFKMQGIRVSFDPDNPGKSDPLGSNTLKISRKTFFFTGTSMIQEWILNALILGTVIGLDDITQTHVLNLFLNGLLSAYSFVPAERLKSKFLIKAEKAILAENPEMAKTLNNYAWWIAFSWWNLAFPLMKNSHLLLTGNYETSSAWIAGLPFIIVGTAGYLLEASEEPVKENFLKIIKKSWSQPRCKDLLTVVKQ